MKKLLLAVCLVVMSAAAAFPAAEVEEKDPRLDQRVTIKAIGKPLGDFLKVVSEATGVKMTAHKGSAENKVCVFVKDLPLSELQEALKTVLHVQCTREGRKGEWDYEFWEDAKTRRDIELMKQQEVKELQETIRKLIADSKLSEDDLLKKFKDEDSIPYDLTDPQSRAVLSALDKAPIDRVWQGQTVTLDRSHIPADRLSELMQSINETAAQQRRDFEAYEAEHPEDFEDTEAGPYDPETRWTDVGSIELQMTQDSFQQGMWLEITVNGALELVDPQSVPAGEDYYSGDVSAGFSISGTAYDMNGPLDDLLAKHPELAEEEAGDDASDADTEPGATSPDTPTISLELKEASTPYQMLGLLAEETGSNIISDYFAHNAERRLGATEDFPADAIFDVFGIEFDADIVQKGDLRLVISKRWYRLRECEIPGQLVNRWKEALDKQGYLSIREVLEISALTEEQMDSLGSYGLPSAYQISMAQDALDLIRSFTQTQWTTAMSEAGLPVTSLKAEQHQALATYAASYDDEPSGDPQSGSTAGEAKPKPEVLAIKLYSEKEKWGETGPEFQRWNISLVTTDGEWSLPLPTLLKVEDDELSPVWDADDPVEISVSGKS